MVHSELSTRDRSPETPADLLKKSLTENFSKRSRALLKYASSNLDLAVLLKKPHLPDLQPSLVSSTFWLKSHRPFEAVIKVIFEHHTGDNLHLGEIYERKRILHLH